MEEIIYKIDIAKCAKAAQEGWKEVGAVFPPPDTFQALTFAMQEIAELSDVIVRHDNPHFKREAPREGDEYEKRLKHEFEDTFAMLATAALGALVNITDADGGKLLPFFADGADSVSGLTSATMIAVEGDVQALVAIAMVWASSARTAPPTQEDTAAVRLDWPSYLGAINISFRAILKLRELLPCDDEVDEVALVREFFKRKKEKWS